MTDPSQKQWGNLRGLKRTYPLLSTRIKLKNYDLAMALLYHCGASTIQEKRGREWIDLSIQIPDRIPPRSFLLRLRRAEKSFSENFFQQARLKTVSTGPWARRYQKFLRPFALLEDRTRKVPILIIDPRGKKTRNRQPNTLYIESNLAFGTGTHPTTRLCAEFLAEILKETSGASVLDVGCGTGILSMVAKYLKSPKIMGVDNDLEALKVALENFRFNQMHGIKLKSQVPTVPKAWDIIVSNIGLNALIDFYPLFRRILRKNGWLILSGILYRDCIELIKTYQGFTLKKRKNLKSWSALLLQKAESRKK